MDNKRWLQIFEITNINNLTYTNTLMKGKKTKQNITNDANLSHLTNNTHNDINTQAKGNLANTQYVRIKVILVQQKFIASFLSWTSTISGYCCYVNISFKFSYVNSECIFLVWKKSFALKQGFLNVWQEVLYYSHSKGGCAQFIYNGLNMSLPWQRIIQS